MASAIIEKVAFRFLSLEKLLESKIIANWFILRYLAYTYMSRSNNNYKWALFQIF